MRRVWLLGLAMLAGCDQIFDLSHVELPPPDADIDANLGILVDAGPCVSPALPYGKNGVGGTGLLSVCVMTGGGALPLDGITIDTDEETQCDDIVAVDTVPNEVCVKVAGSITVGAIDTKGVRPLVLVAATTLTVNGRVDVAAHGMNQLGAGSNFSGCGAPVDGRPSGRGGGGGAGGSFGTEGGRGGANAENRDVLPRPAMQPDRVHGGCAGGRGGISSPGITPVPTAAGNGGGAIYLIAGGSITLGATAVINASGSGGRGATGSSGIVGFAGPGGGAGGSGGLIGLDAPTIIVDAGAVLMANGGGGGGGGGLDPAGNGADPSETSPRAQASGGFGGTSYGGPGGDGGSVNGEAGNGGSVLSGGGGGGGAGVIHLYTPTPPASPTKVSPAWQVN